jgi:hypothetical protein
MRLLSRVNETFAVDVALRTVFERPTIAGLAAAIVDVQLDAIPDEELESLLDDLGAPLDGAFQGPLTPERAIGAMGEPA